MNPKSSILLTLLSVLLLWGGIGCSSAQPVSVRSLIHHQAMIDFSGLKPVEHFEPVKAQAAPPASWQQLALKRHPMYTDQQWRSPSGATAVGVAHVRMPLPLGSRALLWFAKNQYAKQGDDGRMIGQWIDALGRSWFEAENNKYHVRGFIVTRGFEAWIVYTGRKTTEPTDVSEIALGARSLETIVPMPNGKPAVASLPRD
ncbi:MAG TPA: hypothetical protein VGR35_18670 [Tepidisphaeraceae bacterium]|nr:hypothetical protein [Tepidisphaeraceae bacterium]